MFPNWMPKMPTGAFSVSGAFIFEPVTKAF
jgi:hypothetical protein